MKFKLLLILLSICFCITGVYADKLYNPSDFMDVKKDGHIKHIVNPEQLLSPKEEYNLNAKLDSIYRETGIDISIVLFSNMRSSLYETSDKFATELHAYWKTGLYPNDPDSSLVMVYNQQKTDFGYFLGTSLIHSKLGTILVDLKEDLHQEQKARRKASYSLVIQKLLPEIEKVAEEEKDKQNKIARNQKAIRTAIEPMDMILSLTLIFVTLLYLYVWTNRKRRMAQKYSFIEEAKTYLNNKAIRISFFSFSYIHLLLPYSL